jgi:hypothetical protein
MATTSVTFNLGTPSAGTHTIEIDVVEGDAAVGLSGASAYAITAPHTMRAVAGASTAYATLTPGADVPTAAVRATLVPPVRTAAPGLPTAATVATFRPPTISAAPSLPTSAAVATFVPPEVLSSDTGHRMRAVAGASQAVVLLVPGADVPTSTLQASTGAWALSAEVPFPTAATVATLVAPLITLSLPASAMTATFVAPSLSGALALPTSALRMTFRAPSISDGSAPAVVPSNPWRKDRTRLGYQRPWAQRLARRR